MHYEQHGQHNASDDSQTARRTQFEQLCNHHFRAARRREVQRRVAVVVGQIDIGAEVEMRIDREIEIDLRQQK
jgi:hypothetical protein